MIPTARKVELIEALAAHRPAAPGGDELRAPDVIPQLADAEQVLAAIDVPAEVSLSVLIPNERGLDTALALREAGEPRAAGVRRGQRVPVGLRDPQPQERQPLDRRVARRGCERVLARAREAGPALRGRDLDLLRLPLRGGCAGRAGARDRRRAAGRGRPGGRLRRHDRAWPTRARCASSSSGARSELRGGRADGPLPQHPRPGAGQRARGAGGGRRLASSRASASSAAARCPAGATGNIATRGPRLDARRDGHRDGHRPAGAARLLAERAQEVLGRPLGSHTLVAGPVDWHR